MGTYEKEPTIGTTKVQVRNLDLFEGETIREVKVKGPVEPASGKVEEMAAAKRLKQQKTRYARILGGRLKARTLGEMKPEQRACVLEAVLGIARQELYKVYSAAETDAIDKKAEAFAQRIRHEGQNAIPWGLLHDFVEELNQQDIFSYHDYRRKGLTMRNMVKAQNRRERDQAASLHTEEKKPEPWAPNLSFDREEMMLADRFAEREMMMMWARTSPELRAQKQAEQARELNEILARIEPEAAPEIVEIRNDECAEFYRVSCYKGYASVEVVVKTESGREVTLDSFSRDMPLGTRRALLNSLERQLSKAAESAASLTL